MRFMRLVLAPLILLTVALAGCSGSTWQSQGFRAADPDDKLAAITRAGRTNDRSAIPQLIEQLDSDDPAVRMFSIQALHRITGEDHGYRYHDPKARRDLAVDRWAKAYRTAALDQP